MYTYAGLPSENLIEMMRSWGWIVHIDEPDEANEANEADEASDRFGSDGWGSDKDDYTNDYDDEEMAALDTLPQQIFYVL